MRVVQCIRLLGLSMAVLLSQSAFSSESFNDWFDRFKDTATDAELHEFLYAMPKGGDLHQHLSGSIFPEWWWRLALRRDAHGIEYYAKTQINDCSDTSPSAIRPAPYALLYQTIARHRLEALSDCERSEFLPLREFSESQQTAWMNGIWLDKPSEGREAFFETHWQRLGDLTANPWIIAEALALHMKAFAAEGLIYLEPQVTLMGYLDIDGRAVPPEDVAAVIRKRVTQPDVLALNLTIRFQQAVLRFLPDAESKIAEAYRIASRESEWVAINLVGREDDERGHPKRFLETFLKLRRTHPGIRLSIHAGESEFANSNIRDTLLLGADRIGHGLNLLSDPDTLRSMRFGPHLVEINLISNLLLEYVETFDHHPFPELLRIGVPVALSTDDRGMWDSSMTDEYFVAVKTFQLSWAEIKRLSENSLRFAFVEEPVRQALLADYAQKIKAFEFKWQMQGAGLSESAGVSPKRGFVCRKYALCALP